MNLFEIKNDCFDISNRIKLIDKNYKIMFNAIKGTFELYYLDTYQLAFPYPTLDYRAVLWVYMTQNKNFEELSKRIDIENEVNIKNQINTIKSDMNKTIEEQLFAK